MSNQHREAYQLREVEREFEKWWQIQTGQRGTDEEELRALIAGEEAWRRYHAFIGPRQPPPIDPEIGF